MDKGTIYFYDRPSDRVLESNIFLNNFFHSPFIIDGKHYDTVEHYYQACKFSGNKYEEIRQSASPDEAKRKAHEFEWNEDEWSVVKDKVMMVALQAKFDQHPDLKQKLLETGNAKLVEDSARDPYWGGVLDNSFNRLGELLEELREKYRYESES